MKTDPDESVNVAGQPRYAQEEARLREIAERDWNGPALRKAVLQNQRERLLVQSSAEHGTPNRWDIEPIETGTYDPQADFVNDTFGNVEL